ADLLRWLVLGAAACRVPSPKAAPLPKSRRICGRRRRVWVSRPYSHNVTVRARLSTSTQQTAVGLRLRHEGRRAASRPVGALFALSDRFSGANAKHDTRP